MAQIKSENFSKALWIMLEETFDWGEIWRTVSVVSEDEWEDIWQALCTLKS